MPEEQLKAFLEAVKADAGLQVEGSSDMESLAQKSGYDVTLNDIRDVLDDELSEISGGPIVPGRSIAEIARANVGITNENTTPDTEGTLWSWLASIGF